MKWITREHAKVDRIACPWLIKKFIDKDAEFLFVPAHKVSEYMKEENDKAIPFDIPNVELAKIVRGADTNNRKLTPYSEGLAAIAAGFSVTSKDDYDNMVKQFPLYDALFGFCKSDHKEKLLTSRH